MSSPIQPTELSAPQEPTITSTDSHFSVAKPLEEFSLFPNLPTELRFKIWHIYMQKGDTMKAGYKPEPVTGSYFIFTKPPAAFGICTESRHEALRMHEHLKVTQYHQTTGKLPDTVSQTWFRYTSDTIHLSLNQMKEEILPADVGVEPVMSEAILNGLFDILVAERGGAERVESIAFNTETTAISVN